MADDEKKDAKKAKDEGEKKSSPFKMVIINALVIFVAAGAGAAAGFTVFKPEAPKQDEKQVKKEKPKDEFDLGTAMTDKTKNEIELFELDQLVANLDIPQQNRYIKAKITLAVPKSIFLKLKPILDKKKTAISDRIRTYLLGLTLAEVRGEKNVRKRKREIRDIINKEFMPNKKPLIDHILFADWTVS